VGITSSTGRASVRTRKGTHDCETYKLSVATEGEAGFQRPVVCQPAPIELAGAERVLWPVGHAITRPT